MPLTVKQIDYGSEDYRASWKLREMVLRFPLGLNFTDADKEAEKQQIHIAGYLGDKLCAAAVLAPQEGGAIRMQRVAVHEDLRGQKLGSELVAFAEKYAAENGYKQIFCHVRSTAVPFYTNLGFETVGQPFIEQTIPHQKMVKNLAA